MEKLEQMMQIYHIIYIGCLVITLLFAAITIILAIRWRIWEAVGIISGKVAAKVVADVGKEKKQKNKGALVSAQASEVTTEKLWYREAQSRPPLGSDSAQGGQSTVVLQQEQNATVVLQQESNATVLLQQNTYGTNNGTVVLSAENQNFGRTEELQNLNAEPMRQNVWQMQILDEIIEIHSQEKM